MDQNHSALPPMNSAHSQVMPFSALGPNPTQYTFEHFRPKPCPNIIQQELQRFVFLLETLTCSPSGQNYDQGLISNHQNFTYDSQVQRDYPVM